MMITLLRYILLMKNILYIVQKVKDSMLRNLLGDRWIRTHRGQIRQWHTSYLRSAWGKALMCLKDERIDQVVRLNKFLKKDSKTLTCVLKKFTGYSLFGGSLMLNFVKNFEY
ncbi:putative exocyst complex component Exo70, cullin repeat-like-containing domain superfamily [Helianthus debilis subsp. tardiflorus]